MADGTAFAAAWFLLAATLVLLVYLLYTKLPPVMPVTANLPFLEHANELRNRLVRLFGVLTFWIAVFLTVRFERLPGPPFGAPYPVLDVYGNAAAQVYYWLAQTNLPPDVQLIVTQPAEAVAVQLEVALLLAVVVAFPFLLFETWAFFSPGLSGPANRFLVQSLAPALVLFLGGAAFGLKLMAPLLFRVLYAFSEPLGALAFLSAGALVGTVATITLLFGAAFELPLLMALLTRTGLVQPRFWLHYWRHATLVIFIVAALVTDPTVVSQMVVGLVLLVLYWSGVGASWFVARAPTAEASKPARAVRPL